MAEFLHQLQDVFLNLFNSQALMATLAKPEMVLAAFVALNLIVFTETGLLIGFCLPGDSLLVTTGIVFYQIITVHGGSPALLPLLLTTLCVSAVVGDSVGYAIGYRAGPRLFTRDQSLLFRKDHLLAARAFYEQRGGVTVVLARFIPLIRTFAPVVAGAGRMDYRKFLAYNVLGGVGWVVSMVLVGYYLTPLVNPPLKRVFGESFEVHKYIEVVILAVVFLSVAPLLWKGAQAYLKRRRAALPAGALVHPQ